MAPSISSHVPKSWSSADQVILPESKQHYSLSESAPSSFMCAPSLFRSKLHFSLRMDLAMTCSSLSLLFFFSLHIHFLVPSSGEFQKFLDCAPYDCGDQEIGYPFRHVEQPSYCGYPGYELDCDGGNLTLSMKSLDYGVIHINESAKILEVVRKDLSEDICAQPFVDTTLNFTLFNYTSIDSNFTLFFDCNSWATPPLHRFTCPDSPDGYFALSADPANPRPGVCKSSVLIPISGEALDRLPPPPPPSSTMEGEDYGDDIIDVLNEGFEITWIANTSQCENCNKSGGRCGCDLEKRQFSCFCRDGAYSRTCPSGMYAYSHVICSFQLAKAAR